MTVTGWSPGQGVTGYIADSDNPFDPATDPYPPSNPTHWLDTLRTRGSPA